MKKLITVLVTILFWSTAPVVAQDSEQDLTRMEHVMATHDEVMKEMPKLSKLINKLQTKADTSTSKEKYQNAIVDLKNVNKSMMDWMAGFGNRFEADEMMNGKKLSVQKEKWLLEEEQKITTLKDEIDLSIAKGQAVLEE